MAATADPASRHRVEAALAGTFPLEDLSDEEGIVLDSEVQARLDERLRKVNLGAVLAARGVTTVALTERGELTERRPTPMRMPTRPLG